LCIDLKPKIIVFHTEGQLNKGKAIFVVNELLTLMRGIGYQAQMEILNAVNYSVPQEKSWTFIIGVRKEIGIKPAFPEASDKLVTTKDAIGDLTSSESDVEASVLRLEMVKRHFPPGCTFEDVKRAIENFELPLHSAYYKRDRWDEPYYRLSNSTTRPFHPQIDRLLSVQEAKRLQTFSDNFKCMDWKEICSAVPPLLMRKIVLF
jgi:DNA (cytosine-5)-methyltransferase 1